MSRPWAGITGDLHPATKVSEADRHRALERLIVGREPPKAIAMDLGVRATTVCHWARQAGYIRGWVPRKKSGASVVGGLRRVGGYDPGVHEKGGDPSRPAPPDARAS